MNVKLHNLQNHSYKIQFTVNMQTLTITHIYTQQKEKQTNITLNENQG